MDTKHPTGQLSTTSRNAERRRRQAQVLGSAAPRDQDPSSAPGLASYGCQLSLALCARSHPPGEPGLPPSAPGVTSEDRRSPQPVHFHLVCRGREGAVPRGPQRAPVCCPLGSGRRGFESSLLTFVSLATWGSCLSPSCEPSAITCLVGALAPLETGTWGAHVLATTWEERQGEGYPPGIEGRGGR